MEFPLKTGFFPQVRLTAEERRQYARTGERSARALRCAVQTLNWKKTLEKDGVTYAQAHCIEGAGRSSTASSATATEVTDGEMSAARPAASACLMMSATAFAAGTIIEVLEALASPVTEDYRHAMHFLHGSRFVDGVCLHTITPSTPTVTGDRALNPQSRVQALASIKWAAFDDGKALNAAGFAAGTDYCFLEHAGIQHSNASTDRVSDDSEPETFGFSVQESIVRESEVPSLAGFGLARGNFHRTGVLILPTDRADVVQITSILQMSVADRALSETPNAPSGTSSNAGKPSALGLALARQMRRRVAAVGRLDLLLERRRLNTLQLVARAQWVADDARKACAVCDKPFALRRRKHHCRHCGEVVCASCAPTRELDVDAVAASVRICTACVVQARVGPQIPGGHDAFVRHWYHVASSSFSRASSNQDVYRHSPSRRRTSASSGSSNFSIASDSQMSARLTRAGFGSGTGASIYGPRAFPNTSTSSSGSSSSCSLSEFDSFDGFAATNAGNQETANAPNRQQQPHQCQQRRGSARPAGKPTRPPTSLGSWSGSVGSAESCGDLLDRIRGMKADLSTLTTSFHRHNSNISNVSSTSNTSSASVGPTTFTTFSATSDGSTSNESHESSNNPTYDGISAPSSTIHNIPEDATQDTRTGNTTPAIWRGVDHGQSATVDSDGWMRSSEADGAADVDFISSSDDFTLLCPDMLHRRSRGRGSSMRQEAGEKSRRSTRISNMSFLSTFSSSTLLDDDDTDENQEQEANNSASGNNGPEDNLELEQELERGQEAGTVAFGQRSGNHTELHVLRRQVEGLHRSLAAATTELNSFREHGMPHHTRAPVDAVVARREATYSMLVKELHEIMGLPQPRLDH